jgi:hypothetical protein
VGFEILQEAEIKPQVGSIHIFIRETVRLRLLFLNIYLIGAQFSNEIGAGGRERAGEKAVKRRCLAGC